jgi:hypothetical protein
MQYTTVKHNNTELAIHALDQVHCWGAYFHPRIRHYEKFTPQNFQPHLFSKQRWLVDHRCTLELLMAKTVMYTVPYSSEAVKYVNKFFYSIYKYLPKYICRIISTIKKTNIGGTQLPDKAPPSI